MSPHPEPSRTRPAPELLSTIAIVASAALGFLLVAFLGLREFAFTDYEQEAMPAVKTLLDGDVSGFLQQLPGYGGAVILQSPFAAAGNLIGPDHDLWSWRAQALPGMLLLAVIGVVLGLRVRRALSGAGGLGWACFTALLVAGAPFGLLAQQTGHPEELLVTGMAVGAVLLAMRGNVMTAAVVIGLAAAAKPWAVIAVPVVLLAARDRRSAISGLVACAAAAALLLAPAAMIGGTQKVTAAAHSSTSGIFKPDNLYWFAGRENPEFGRQRQAPATQLFQRDATKAAWAQRLEPAWAARWSHPSVVAFALLLSLAFWRFRRGLDARRQDLLLLLSTVCLWRCLLDTWNVQYYALGALVALAAWEASRGRPPVAAGIATTLAWVTFQIFPVWTMTPDAHTAMYLAWALPLGLGMVVRLLAPAIIERWAVRVLRPVAGHLPTLAKAFSTPSAASVVRHET